MARPSVFTPDLGDKICALLAEGKSLRTICRDNDDLPDPQSIYRWLRLADDPECDPGLVIFRDQYVHAREDQAHAIAEEALEIADDGTNDYVEEKRDSGVHIVADHENINRSRLRVDVRKWYLSKVLPKVYGNKVEGTLNLGGAVSYNVDLSAADKEEESDDGPSP